MSDNRCDTCKIFCDGCLAESGAGMTCTSPIPEVELFEECEYDEPPIKISDR